MAIRGSRSLAALPWLCVSLDLTLSLHVSQAHSGDKQSASSQSKYQRECTQFENMLNSI